jgi:hypothetical protein
MARSFHIGLAIAAAAALGGCSILDAGFGGSGGGPRRADAAASQVNAIGVNAYLWRAALDTVSFAPLAQVDSNGGVIVTDWYANPNAANDRAKITVTILDRELRADALRVAVARQTLQSGQWLEAPVSAATVQRLEEIILTRARDLRRASIG